MSLRIRPVTKQKKNEPGIGLNESVEATPETDAEAPEVTLVEPDMQPDETGAHSVSEIAPPEAEKSGVSHRIGPVEKALLEVVRDALARGDSVRLPGLGSLNVRMSAPRVGRNPRTGERIEIPATGRVRFSQSPQMRSLLND